MISSEKRLCKLSNKLSSERLLRVIISDTPLALLDIKSAAFFVVLNKGFISYFCSHEKIGKNNK